MVRGRKRVGLVRARKAAGLTQEEEAYRLGVDRSTVGRWESGESEPLPWLRPKLANLLGITPARLEELLLAVDTKRDPSATSEILCSGDDGITEYSRGRPEGSQGRLVARSVPPSFSANALGGFWVTCYQFNSDQGMRCHADITQLTPESVRRVLKDPDVIYTLAEEHSEYDAPLALAAVVEGN